jgi:hypothetical protein
MASCDGLAQVSVAPDVAGAGVDSGLGCAAAHNGKAKTNAAIRKPWFMHVYLLVHNQSHLISDQARSAFGHFSSASRTA